MHPSPNPAPAPEPAPEKSATPITDANEFSFYDDCDPAEDMVVIASTARQLETDLAAANALAEARGQLLVEARAEAEDLREELDLSRDRIGDLKRKLDDQWKTSVLAIAERDQARKEADRLREALVAADAMIARERKEQEAQP